MANAIRALAMDAVQKANSGHPGMPMGMADIAVALWTKHLRHNPSDPKWLGRDRFLLSNGHGSMLQYALLHLAGYDLTIDDLKNFRQLHSKTPGHPEIGVTPGVETSTGPLGQGIANAVGIFAEVDLSRIQTRHEQGWVDVIMDDIDAIFKLANEKLAAKESISIAYHGNIVDLLEAAVAKDFHIDLLSDQTSCHNVYNGGYCPVGMSFEERTRELHENRDNFIKEVDKTLHRHYKAIKTLTERGTYFFDYGNSFMKAMYDAGVKEISKNGYDDKDGFIWPSYVEDIMGPILFDYGYGPFRWVCLSGKPEDLDATDKAAMEVIDPNRRGQDRDNWIWIRDAKKNKLVVGTQARILYQDAEGRRDIGLAFNKLVREGKIGPVMMGRDHHDVSGTDSPFRETSNIKDGSNVMADMAVQCFAGNAARGMSLCALHNGGGVGIGKAINGGFGLLLDGSERVDEILRSAMMWDVMGGVARRNWARNDHAVETSVAYNKHYAGKGHITIPFIADDALVDETVDKFVK